MLKRVLLGALPGIAFNQLWIGVYLLACGHPGWAAASAAAALAMVGAHHVLSRGEAG